MPCDGLLVRLLFQSIVYVAPQDIGTTSMCMYDSLLGFLCITGLVLTEWPALNTCVLVFGPPSASLCFGSALVRLVLHQNRSGSVQVVVLPKSADVLGGAEDGDGGVCATLMLATDNVRRTATTAVRAGSCTSFRDCCCLCRRCRSSACETRARVFCTSAVRERDTHTHT